MYCFRCGRKLPGREINCPDCDTPKKRRQRRHKRMILGLFIFLAGAFVGSLFDTYIFKGEIWKHSLFNKWIKTEENNSDTTKTVAIASESNNIKVEVRYDDKSTVTTLYSEKEDVSVSQPINESRIATENEPKEDKVVKEKTEPVLQNIEPVKDNSAVVESSVSSSEIKKEEKTIVSDETTEVSSSSDLASDSASSETPEQTEPVNKAKNSDEVIIVEEYENGSTDVVSSGSETTLFTEISSNDSSEEKKIPEGNLVYKSVALLEQSDRDSYHGFVSRNGKELLFASNRQDYNGKPTFQCFIKSPSEKSVPKKVFEWKGNVWTPELTPDGNMIVFSSDSEKPEHIFLYDRKSGNSMALTSGSSKNMMPCISPDGKKIAFVSNRGDGKNRIYVLELFKKDKITQVTKGNVNDREPRWTPDGKSIIFTRIIENMKISHIMKVSFDPLGEPEAIVKANSRNWMADISPDNKLLAFTRSLNAGGSKNVIVLQDLSSGKEEVLSFPGIYESFRPVWNADCSGFVFHVAKKNGKCIYQANFSRE
ncbi:MAG: PD40 domain-containing protein [Candidatus Riflebacteria bacterium]|nr:PD40 domain-containing protein [Candidatus Riflebacteria bacterium]